MPTSHEEQLQLRIRELEKEVARLHTQIKHQRYGLNWIDVPEAFDHESENRIPTLEEVPELSFKTNDDKPTHILIEGDNYHALTCLNYTHRGKVDVIYIDPPYNTGSDGFIYKDKRMLDRYPDGTPIPAGSPQRHSYWLSFMHRRLELAKNLLSERGVIFISIDDNEVANLKLLCDEVFEQQNFVDIFSWNKTETPANLASKTKKAIEYILCYTKYNTTAKFKGLSKTSTSNNGLMNQTNSVHILRFPANKVDTKLKDGIYSKGSYGTSSYNIELLEDTEVKNGLFIKPVSLRGKFKWGQENLEREIGKGTQISIKTKAFSPSYEKREYEPEKPWNIINKSFGVDTNETASAELKQIMGASVFKFPKPTSLIKYLINFIEPSIILDFFAGSGTTLHATMKLNEEDGGKRQCILVQYPEKTWEIVNGKKKAKKGSEDAFKYGFDNITEITYERNRRVMQGYTDAKGNEVAGLGNSLKYYRTAFVGENDAKHANEQDRLVLSQKAGCLLALAENTLDETLRTSHYQLFTDGERLTAVYFQEDLQRFEEFVEQVRSKALPTSVYVFCWGSAEEFLYNFEDIPNVSLKSIPEPILKIYQTLNA